MYIYVRGICTNTGKDIHDHSLSCIGTDTSNIDIHDHSLSCIGTDTSNIDIHDHSFSCIGTIQESEWSCISMLEVSVPIQESE
jgi:uncharacterized Zn-finger protein